MAFVNPFDPTTPTDADLVSEGDDRIREIKAGLIERLGQVIEGWPDTDPLTLKYDALSGVPTPVTVDELADRPAAEEEGQLFYARDQNTLFVTENDGGLTWRRVDNPIAVDELADRPASPARAGDLFYASDTQVLFVGNEALAWKSVPATFDVGAANARPVAGLRLGHAYLATDTGAVSVWNGVGWRDITPAAETVFKTYNDALAASSKAGALSIVRILYLKVTGVADGSGEASVNFSELVGYNINNLQLASGQEIKRTGVTTGTAGTVSIEIDAGGNRVKLGDLGAGNTYEVTLILGFTS